MPRLTEPSKAVELFEQSYDFDYYLGLWLDMQRAFGTPDDVIETYSRGTLMPTERPYGDMIVRFPDVRPVTFEEGRSPRLMTNSNLIVSRMASKEPSYTLKGIPKIDAEVRKKVLEARMTDDTNGMDWFEQRAQAFDDGDSLGVGVMEIGLIENRYSHEDMLAAQHVPILQHYWDWWTASPVRSPWSWSVFYVSPERAAARYGWKKVKDHIKRDEHLSQLEGKPAEYVRICRRFDTGFGPKGDPTVTTWIGSYNNKPVEHEYNKFERNPHAYPVGYCKPGFSRPIGRIFVSRNDAEAIHDLERRLRDDAVNGGDIDVVYEKQLDSDDLKKAQAGKQRLVRSTGALDKAPFYRIPARTANPDLWRLLDYYHMRFGVSGNVSDIDTASGGGANKTATQIAEEANRLNMNMTWTVAMMAQFQKREVECARVVAKAGDRHPTTLDVFDSPVTVNQPGMPESWLSEWFDKPAQVLIDKKAMTVEEDRLEAAFRLTYIEKLADLAARLDPQGQVVDRKVLIEEYVKAGGKDDPEKVILKQSPLLPGGLPMAGPAGQPMPMPAV